MIVLQVVSVFTALVAIAGTPVTACRYHSLTIKDFGSPHLNSAFLSALFCSAFIMVSSRAVAVALFTSYFRIYILFFIAPYAAGFFLVVWSYAKYEKVFKFSYALYVTAAFFLGFDLFTTHYKGKELLAAHILSFSSSS